MRQLTGRLLNTLGFDRPPFKLVLLSGIPATGKSTFGRWLQKERGFLHWDLEKQLVLALDGRRLAWPGLLTTRAGIRRFVRELGRMHPRVVLDWGFPPERLPIIVALQEEGVEAWWFDGDRTAAVESFQRRGTVPMEAWNIQLPKIDHHWSRIEETFGLRMIKTLDANGHYADPGQISRRILDEPESSCAGDSP
ncbi:MAG: hypothetical protein ACREK9_18325 [Candidatus Rokuibacteriota bacterium]